MTRGRRRSILLAAVALGLLSTSTADAQSLDLDEVLDAVEARHPKARSARAKVASARGKATSAEGNFDAKIAAEAEAVPIGKAVYSTVDAKVEQPLRVAGARVFAGWAWGREDIPVYYGERLTPPAGKLKAGVEVPLWRDLGIDGPRAELATRELEVTVAEASAAQVRLGLFSDAADAWVKWVESGRKVTIAEELLALAERRDSWISRRIEEGAIAAIERVDNLRAIASRQNALALARRDLKAAALKLSLYVRDAEGRPSPPAPEALPETFPTPRPEMRLEEALVEAAEARPEVLVLDRVRETIAVERELAENDMAPQIDLGVIGEQGLGGDGTVLGPSEVRAQLSFSLPVQRRKARGKLSAATAAMEQVDSDLQWSRDQITAEVRRAYVAYETARERLELVEREVQLAEEVAAAERKRFEAGSTDLLKVNLREQYVAEARKKRVEARGDLVRAWVDVEVAVGRVAAP